MALNSKQTMNQENFTVGFWNYADCGVVGAKGSVGDWKELGMNAAMSFEYRGPADREYILELLNEAQRQGIKVIVCDCRVRWSNYSAKGSEGYKRDVEAAVTDFGRHAAFLAFHVGDEPDAGSWNTMLAAAKLVNELSVAYVNFFPLFNEDFEGRLGTDHEGYCKKLVSAVRETGLKMLSYDCYDQCFEVDREIGINQYFRNLNAFSRLAKECGVPLWTCLLSVGHWCYRVPTEDDLRWQLSTAAAHGAKGVMWFYLYQRYLESSYRNSPFDLYYRRTETFDRLARQNRIFLEHYAGRLCQAEPVRIYHYRTAYGGTPLYHEGCIDGLTLSEKYGTPLIISQFEDRDGQFLVLVNNSQTVSAKVSGRYGEKAIDEWLAPGQMTIL